MKNIFSKILIAFLVITIVTIGLKISNNLLAEASTNNNSNVCGVNNGVIWNGSECVRVCDIFHPWDPNQMKCSTTGSVNYYGNQGYGNNCVAAYGSNFYFNGKNCVEMNPMPNVNYYGNPYNGGVTNPVYGYVNYNNLAQTQNYNNYNNYNNYPSNNSNWYPNNNSNTIIYPNNNSNCICDSNYAYQAPTTKKTTTTTYIITTTISQPKGTPIYLGNLNYSNYNYPYNSYYYGNDYDNYDYLNSNYNSDYYSNYDNQGYPYINPMTGEGSYFQSGPTGYYDQYGVYHY